MKKHLSWIIYLIATLALTIFVLISAEERNPDYGQVHLLATGLIAWVSLSFAGIPCMFLTWAFASWIKDLSKEPWSDALSKFVPGIIYIALVIVAVSVITHSGLFGGGN